MKNKKQKIDWNLFLSVIFCAIIYLSLIFTIISYVSFKVDTCCSCGETNNEFDCCPCPNQKYIKEIKASCEKSICGSDIYLECCEEYKEKTGNEFDCWENNENRFWSRYE